VLGYHRDAAKIEETGLLYPQTVIYAYDGAYIKKREKTVQLSISIGKKTE